VNHEYLVKWRAAGQNLQACATLASVRWRSEQYNSVGGHREVVRLLWVAYEPFFVFGVDGHGTSAI
jgi:hypothetical protein